jgi:hypothetical protein
MRRGRYLEPDQRIALGDGAAHFVLNLRARGEGRRGKDGRRGHRRSGVRDEKGRQQQHAHHGYRLRLVENYRAVDVNNHVAELAAAIQRLYIGPDTVKCVTMRTAAAAAEVLSHSPLDHDSSDGRLPKNKTDLAYVFASGAEVKGRRLRTRSYPKRRLLPRQSQQSATKKKAFAARAPDGGREAMRLAGRAAPAATATWLQRHCRPLNQQLEAAEVAETGRRAQ